MMSWDIIQKATQKDGTMLKLMEHIMRGMPDSDLELDKSLREYHRFRHNRHVVNGVLCYRDCIVVPAALRTKVLLYLPGQQVCLPFQDSQIPPDLSTSTPYLYMPSLHVQGTQSQLVMHFPITLPLKTI